MLPNKPIGSVTEPILFTKYDMDISCQFPWIGTFVYLNKDIWKFCCKTTYHSYEVHKQTVSEVKQHFLEGKKHPACDSCWLEESKGGTSFRKSNDRAKTTIQILKENPKPRVIDIMFGDVCNMNCIICDPWNSTTWQHIRKIPIQTETMFDKTWSKLSVFIKNNPTVDLIIMHGGEPSMDPNFEKITDNLLSIGYKGKIKIITNGNYSDNLKIKFHKSIKKFIENGNDLEIAFSLDGAGINGEWLRGGLDINKWSTNILTIVENEVKVSVHISISILNLQNHVEILELLEEIKIIDKVDIQINMVNRPHYFSIANLGSATKDFLPNWPENTPRSWTKYRHRFYKFITPQLMTKKFPDKIMLKKLIAEIEKYNDITKQVMPDYYQNLVIKLQNL